LTLSGGELQRTFLAQLFAQNPQLLILDEPTNHLDLVYQKQTFELIRKWIEKTGGAVISVVHDLSLAKAYGTDALLLDKGQVIASGRIDKVLTSEKLSHVYSMDVYKWMNKMLSGWQH
jgi:iron complex transport system ATP-binding protein